MNRPEVFFIVSVTVGVKDNLLFGISNGSEVKG
jgi:hypothetical protein